MKVRNYEKNNLIICFIIMLFIIEIIFICFLFVNERFNYKKFEGVVRKKDLLVLMVSEEDSKYFYKNNYLYDNDKKKSFKIVQIDKKVYRDGNLYYDSILIKFKMDNEVIENDILEVSLMSEKIKLIEIFKIIWEV